MNDGPSDAHYEFAAAICGFDPRDASRSTDADTGSPDFGQPADSGAGQLTASPVDGGDGGGARGELGEELSKDDAEANSKAKIGPDDAKSQPIRLGGVAIVIREEELVEVPASGVLDFLNKAPGPMGGAGRLGYTSVKTDPPRLKTDDTGKVIDVTLTAEIKTRRAVGKGTWDTNNTTAIREVEAANKQHEQNHQRDFQRLLNDKFGPAFTNGLIGKTKNQALAEISAAGAAFNKDASESVKTLDAAEGKTLVTQNPDQTFTVAQVGA